MIDVVNTVHGNPVATAVLRILVDRPGMTGEAVIREMNTATRSRASRELIALCEAKLATGTRSSADGLLRYYATNTGVDAMWEIDTYRKVGAATKVRYWDVGSVVAAAALVVAVIALTRC